MSSFLLRVLQPASHLCSGVRVHVKSEHASFRQPRFGPERSKRFVVLLLWTCKWFGPSRLSFLSSAAAQWRLAKHFEIVAQIPLPKWELAERSRGECANTQPDSLSAKRLHGMKYRVAQVPCPLRRPSDPNFSGQLRWPNLWLYRHRIFVGLRVVLGCIEAKCCK